LTSAFSSRVVIAMSGGVDSSVCAALMREEGFDCIGMTMRLWKGPVECDDEKSCCGAESVDDARLVCDTVGIPYYAINFREEFWREVVEVFAHEYYAGRTPSPCILCNEKLKFQTLYEKAVEVGADKVCTGHYARIVFNKETGRWNLLKGVDANKDQSYFLFSMTQDQLSKTLFPLGDKTKGEIREMAEIRNLVTAKKAESQDICFIPNGDYAGFLEKYFPDLARPKGKIRHVDGQVLGEHKGIHRVTIGQRRGLDIAFGEPLYVTGIDAEANEIEVGPLAATKQREFLAEKVNWISRVPDIEEEIALEIRIRSRSPAAPGKVYPLPNNRARVVFDEPQSSITPGQATVFYDGDAVFGGGWIE
jgi:tRNA-uridine 2-sulfurtransferase